MNKLIFFVLSSCFVTAISGCLDTGSVQSNDVTISQIDIQGFFMAEVLGENNPDFFPSEDWAYIDKIESVSYCNDIDKDLFLSSKELSEDGLEAVLVFYIEIFDTQYRAFYTKRYFHGSLLAGQECEIETLEGDLKIEANKVWFYDIKRTNKQDDESIFQLKKIDDLSFQIRRL